MSLDWNLEKIADYKNLCWHEVELPPSQGGGTERRLTVVTEAIIFETMGVGINEITAANAEKFHARCEERDEIMGHLIIEWVDNERHPRSPTLEEVRAHIGLSTNASRKTDAQFSAELDEEVQRQERRERKREARAS